MDVVSGQIDYFGFVDYIDQDADHTFSTFGAIHYDAKDPLDNSAYIYFSFIHNEDIQIVKIRDSDKKLIWNYRYHAETTEVGDFLKEPMFIIPNYENEQRLFLLGRLDARASVTLFSKSNMAVDWNLQISHPDTSEPVYNSVMNLINAYIQPKKGTQLFLCGWAYEDFDSSTQDTKAVFSKIDTSGRVQFVQLWGDGATSTHVNSDSCKGIDYDEYTSELILLLEVTSKSLRPRFSSY
mmetsp:Transcript_12358/g.19201  ORF Transcript_12358/g.19201 Transcript_12358/m.19201 type:complete len:238 (+) Transcript_12358:390-1103(+)